MRKKMFCMTVIAGVVLSMTGCGNKNSQDNELLASVDEAKEVVDFSAFKETEIATEPPETEAPTEPPETEPPETEAQTEPPETAYTMDYDYSDETVRNAIFDVQELDTMADQAFSDVVEEHTEEKNRVRTIDIGNGAFHLSLYADTFSGKTNGKLEITAKEEEQDSVEEVLMLLDTGLNQNNIEKFWNGAYDGANAAYIGLKNTSVEKKDGTIHIIMEKVPAEEGTVPEMEDGTQSGTFTMEDSFCVVDMSGDDPDQMKEILAGTDGYEYSVTEKNVQDGTKSYDKSGELLQASNDCSETVTGTNGSVCKIRTGNTDGRKQLVFEYTAAAGMSDTEMLVKAEYMYRMFYHESFDTGADLSSPYQIAHAVLEKTGDNTFTLTLG